MINPIFEDHICPGGQGICIICQDYITKLDAYNKSLIKDIRKEARKKFKAGKIQSPYNFEDLK